MSTPDTTNSKGLLATRTCLFAGIAGLLVACALLSWDILYGPLSNTWDIGYTREGWRGIVMLSLAGTTLTTAGLVLNRPRAGGEGGR